MGTRTTLPPAPAEPHMAVLEAGADWAQGEIERCGPSYVMVRTTLAPPVGESVRLHIPATCFGELTLETTVRWHERDGGVALQLGKLGPRDLVALRRLVPKRAPDARVATRRRGYRVDGRIDPFAPRPQTTMPLDGIPVSLILLNGEVDGVAIELEGDRATVHAWIDLPRGAHIALRVFEDELMERWRDLPMIVLESNKGVLELTLQRSRWAAESVAVS